jgi:diguanylate cyclase (GGDEF)-like protein
MNFALILPQTDTDLGLRIAANICSLVAGTSVPIAEEPLGITFSAGLATHDLATPFDSPADLIRAADTSLYTAKSAGRNCVRVYQSATAPRRQVA